MKMKLKLSLLAAVLISTTSAFSQDTNFWVFLCFGQSNMESGGRMDDGDRTVDKRFQVMADFDSTKRGWEKGKWYDAVPPLAAKGSGICMVDYFGRTMVANLPPNIRVGVIKCLRPRLQNRAVRKRYFHELCRLRAVLDAGLHQELRRQPLSVYREQARLAQKDGVIKGILLHQGESNPNDLEWPNKVKGIYDNLIKDLNLKAEEVPLLAGETVNADQKGTCAGFNKIMAELPKALPNSYVVSSAGCTCNPDHMHFNSAGSRELGKRYGEKMLSVFRLQSRRSQIGLGQCLCRELA